MKEYIISMFIDNELDTDEKIHFVQKIHEDREFTDRTVDLLEQEKMLRADMVNMIPSLETENRRRFSFPAMRFLMPFASGLAAAVIILIFFLPFPRSPESPKQYPQRFVLYQPDAGKVDIAGSFTDWKVMPMKKAGNSGYWEITLELPEGDHSFSYILDGTLKMPDPTVSLREQDDFGGNNSILHTEVSL